MLEEYVGHKVVVDCRSEFICLGLLKRYDDHFLELRNCDIHDLRDTDTTRENYTAESVASGVKRNRKKALLNRSDVVAISLLEDVIDE